ncbi:MAG: hypothetical protein IPI31_14770 [Bacteroidetes bacterium]|jgi:hypothetical protein|nr:hypothetical protein [Bacteroidota bacterium]MBP8917155.1 hypothetical protein [Chitinophagales bacterium]
MGYLNCKTFGSSFTPIWGVREADDDIKKNIFRSSLIRAFIFACFGVSAEILFTGLKYNLILPLINHENIRWDLTGTSYVWMFFIYGIIPFIFPFVYNKIKNIHILLRAIIYAICCLSLEYFAGFMLDITTGNCPWLYTEGLHLNGYIRLDYFPIWMIFGLVTEKLWLYIIKII